MFSPRYLPLLLLLASAASPAQQDGAARAKIKERELEEVRDRISELKQSMDDSAADRDRLTTELQAAEIRIAEKRQRLRELERQRAYSTKRRGELEASIAEREAELDREATELGAQVRAAYMSGNQEKLKLLLNQRDPASLGRMMTYYGYLNDHRSGNIHSIGARIRELAELRGQVAAEEARLSELASEQSRELDSIQKTQQERHELLASLQNKLASEGREIERLAAQEKDLARLIAELTAILSDYPISSEEPFAEYRGRLTWPVAGTLIHDFGQPRVGGQLKWNGVVLAAEQGREVRAVYHGRVAFADWLAGMGLLVIVDHGDGYMTLYGYNETILKSTGDWVAPGDVLATVGDSGGQARPGLYFEIRKGTRPLNPRRWVTRRPGD
jgi:septal ring factor EnvC (AmiA/AmiB activator)